MKDQLLIGGGVVLGAMVALGMAHALINLAALALLAVPAAILIQHKRKELTSCR